MPNEAGKGTDGEKPFPIHEEEFRYLRTEIKANITAVRQNERYAAIALALVYGWLFTQTETIRLDFPISFHALMWWFPVVIPAILFIRHETLGTEIDMAANYIRKLEEEWHSFASGWEHYVKEFAHRHWKHYESRFWIVLVSAACLASAVLHYQSLDPRSFSKGFVTQILFASSGAAVSVIVCVVIMKQSPRRRWNASSHDDAKNDGAP